MIGRNYDSMYDSAEQFVLLNKLLIPRSRIRERRAHDGSV